jgi:hypothetical protein
VLVEHPGVSGYASLSYPHAFSLPHQLHASDLRNISPASQFARLLRSAPTSHQFPYLESSSLSRGSFLNMAEIISKKCNHQLLKTLPDQDDTIRPGSKYFVLLGLPTLGSRGEERQGLMDEYGTVLLVSSDSNLTLLQKVAFQPILGLSCLPFRAIS